MARIVEVPWPKPGSGGYSVVDAIIGRDEIVAFHWQTPGSVNGRNGHISLVEYSVPNSYGVPCMHDGALSTVAGDLAGNTAPVEAFNDDIAPHSDFHGNDARTGKGGKSGRGPLLHPSTDYYWNVSNVNPQADITAFGVRLVFFKPRNAG